MSDENEINFGPVDLITADAIGKPGERTFFIQARSKDLTLTLLVEKIQLQTLAIGVEQFLTEINSRFPGIEEASKEYDEEKMKIYPPLDPLFRAGELGLTYEAGEDHMILVAKEISQDESGETPARVVNVICTRSQMRAMCQWGLEVASRGRPICPQCGEPMEPEGHFCPKKNGHKH